MNTITINLCEQDRETLSKILKALESMQNCKECAQVSNAYAQELKEVHSKPKPEEHPVADPFPAEPPKAEPKPEKAIKREDVQKKVVELSAAGHKGKVRTIITAYAEKVSDLPEDKMAEVYQKLIELV